MKTHGIDTQKLRILCTPIHFVSYAHENCVLYACQTRLYHIYAIAHFCVSIPYVLVFIWRTIYTHFHETGLILSTVVIVCMICSTSVKPTYVSSNSNKHIENFYDDVNRSACPAYESHIRTTLPVLRLKGYSLGMTPVLHDQQYTTHCKLLITPVLLAES